MPRTTTTQTPTLSLSAPRILGCLALLLASSWSVATQSTPPAPATPAPTPTRLLTRCFHAMGGPSAIEQVQSMEIAATITLDGDDTPLARLDMAFDRAGRSLVRFTFTETDATGTSSSMTTSFGSNGRVAWEQVHPAEGGGWRLLEQSDLNERVAANNWLGRLLRLGSRIDSMRTIDATEFNGTTCWQVAYVGSGDEPMAAFFDRDSKLLQGFRRTFTPPVATGDEQTPSQTLDITFSQWRPVGELTLFHRVQLDQAGTTMQIVYDTLRLNDASPDTFALPPQVKALLPAVPSAPEKGTSNDG